MKHIAYTKPSISELEIKYASDAAAYGWGKNCYDYINKFERLFSEHLDGKYVIATSSCTGALHMGLSALGIGPGDEIIIADINWIASAAPITYLGAKPVFVDILPNTWCIDPEKIEAAITKNTKAIVAVHLYGNLCEMDRILEIAKKFNLFVIEDAAEAIGSVYKGRRAGTIGDFGVFSFHGTKTITTGEGGALVTNNDFLYEKILTLSNHGRSKSQSKQFWADVIGFKYKMSNIEAAIGCAQLERIDELIKRKREIFFIYLELLEDVKCIQMNPVPQQVNMEYGYWMPTVVVDIGTSFDRDILLSIFKEQNIDGRVFFYPLSKLDIFDSCRRNKISYSIYSRAVNLPSYHDLEYKDQLRVVKVIKAFFYES